MEDDNFMDIGLSEEQTKEFPSEDEDESQNSELEPEDMGLAVSQNNNATVGTAVRSVRPVNAERSCSSNVMDAATEQLPDKNEINPPGTNDATLKQTFNLMQTFMVKKGLIDKSMTDEEIQEFLATPDLNVIEVGARKLVDNQGAAGKRNLQQADGEKWKKVDNTMQKGKPSISETTIYTRAIPMAKRGESNLNEQIEKYIGMVRNECTNQNRKVSTSSEEMNTSNESDQVMLVDQNLQNMFVGEMQKGGKAVKPSTSRDPDCNEQPEISPEQLADQIIKDSEKSKAHLHEIPGKVDFMYSATQMDEDYQMLDSHVDDNLRQKIQCFEFVDFAKLLAKNRYSHSYPKWEQAFRVYSNVLTSRFPGKSPELLQYNHTIHSAAMAYQWENVYSYDKEFRYHISRHPTRSWGIILQQAWTMLLKDRLRNGSPFQRNNFGGGKPKKEPCRRFNRGRCAFGLSCKYEHRCSVKKCGKFGHGAHVCRLRNTELNTTYYKTDDKDSAKLGTSSGSS